MLSFCTPGPILAAALARSQCPHLRSRRSRHLRTRHHFNMSTPMGENRLAPAILLTNDDGLDPTHALVLPLARILASHGHSVVVVAPGRDNSACGQRITIGKEIFLQRHAAHEEKFQAEKGSGKVAVFSLSDGSPADCVIVAAEPGTGLLARMGLQAMLCVSGVNMGQNLGNDVLYSGTFAAARQAAMYGVPSIAASLDLSQREEGSEKEEHLIREAVVATARVSMGALQALEGLEVDRGRLNIGHGLENMGGCSLKRAFGKGNIVLNMNMPQGWGGDFEMTRLDCVMYRGAVNVERVPRDEDGFALKIGKREGYVCEFLGAEGSDSVALERGHASVTPVSTWPVPHPLAIKPAVLDVVVGKGLIEWLVIKEMVGAKEKA